MNQHGGHQPTRTEDVAAIGGDDRVPAAAEGRDGTAHGEGIMSGEHTLDMATMFSQEFWDARYRSAGAEGNGDRDHQLAGHIWSGNPNHQLVEQVKDLAPGSALDVGCGEGADAIWLAERGWSVTAVDISPVALERAAARAAEAGETVARRITWQQADFRSWEPPPGAYDLVSAQFIHPPPERRDAIFRALAAAVRPGGTLLIVGHHPADLETSVGRWRMPELLLTAAQVEAVLESDDWQIVVAADLARPALDPDGRPVTIHDAVVRARRRS